MVVLDCVEILLWFAIYFSKISKMVVIKITQFKHKSRLQFFAVMKIYCSKICFTNVKLWKALHMWQTHTKHKTKSRNQVKKNNFVSLETGILDTP